MSAKQTVKFGDICQEVKLTTKDAIADGYDKYIGLEHLDSGSLKIKRWGSIAEDKPSFNRVFKKGHILFGKRRPYLKKAAIAEFDGICSGDIVVMEPKGDLMLPELLPFIVQSDKFWDWAVKTSSGSLSPRTKFQLLAEFQTNLPDYYLQQSLLIKSNKSCEVQKHRDLAQESGIKLTAKLYSSFFGGNVDCGAHRDGVLGDLIEKLLPGQSVNSSSRPADGNEIGVLKVSAVAAGAYNPNENKLVTDKLEIAKLKISPMKGDILLTRANTLELVGDSCVVEIANPNVFIPDKIWKVIVKPNVDRSWLRHLLLYLRLNGFLASVASGTAGSMKNISQVKMLSVPVKIPSEARQVSIGLVLDQLSKVLDSLQSNKDTLQDVSSSILEL